jgi:hypothetical protein
MKGGKFRFFGTACFWNRLAAGGNDAEPLPPLLGHPLLGHRSLRAVLSTV